jgi:hypothetical protein
VLDSQARHRGTSPTDPPPGRPVPRAIRWEPVARQSVARVSVGTEDVELPPKPWNRAAIISPFLALVCAPAGLCVALVAAGQIGLGRQRGIGFAAAGIVIGSLVPVVVCVWSLVH